MTQNERVWEYLQEHGTITAKEAMDELGIFRLGARVYELRKQGREILTEWVTVQNRYGEDCRVKSYGVRAS